MHEISVVMICKQSQVINRLCVHWFYQFLINLLVIGHLKQRFYWINACQSHVLKELSWFLFFRKWNFFQLLPISSANHILNTEISCTWYMPISLCVKLRPRKIIFFITDTGRKCAELNDISWAPTKFCGQLR
jgi:hypothetical protein